MHRARLCGVVLALGACAVPEVLFRCEPNGGCAQAGQVCGEDGVCRATGAITFSPRGGPAGTVVAVVGDRVDEATEVRLGGVLATIVLRSPASVVLVVPVGAPTGKIEIVDAERSRLSSASFRVGPPAAPKANAPATLTVTDARGGCGRCAVALSADGRVAALGAPFDDEGVGASWRFERVGSRWQQRGESARPMSRTWFGEAVALSAAGDVMLAGARGEGPSGGAWVSEATPGGGWTTPTLLQATDATGSASVGAAVALGGDGRSAAIGGFTHDGGVGAVWFFARGGDGAWAQLGAAHSGAELDARALGTSLALSIDAATAVVSGFARSTDESAAWVFRRGDGQWRVDGAALMGTPLPLGTCLGAAVALSGDGTTVALARPSTFRAGAVFVFRQAADGAGWVQEATVAPPSSTVLSRFGTSLSLSIDGQRLLVGTSDAVDGGSGAWLFEHVGASWALAAEGVFTAAGAVEGVGALSLDGQVVLVAGPAADGSAVLRGFVPASSQ